MACFLPFMMERKLEKKVGLKLPKNISTREGIEGLKAASKSGEKENPGDN